MSVRNFLIVLSLFSISISGYAMNYIFGIGYAPSRSWVLDLGAMNHFNDELNLNIFTPASTSQTLEYDIKAYIPLIGRNDLNSGFRLGPTFEAMVGSQQHFNAGIYGQYYFGPWRIGTSVMRTIGLNNFVYSFDMWYFFSSGEYDFVDYLIANIEFNNELPYFSICLIEPF